MEAATRKAATDLIKAFPSTGRRAVADETGPHPFRLPNQLSATVVLATARLFLEESERRERRANSRPPDAFPLRTIPTTE